MEIGSLVAPSKGDPLTSGCSVYAAAVVISVQPFVLISEEGDMRWTQRHRDDFKVVGTASARAAENVLDRISRDPEAARVVKDDGLKVLRSLAG